MKRKHNSLYDKLDGLKAPINKEQSWNDLYERNGFPKKEKKRRFIIWFLGGFALVLLIATLAINQNTTNSLPTEKEVTPIDKGFSPKEYAECLLEKEATEPTNTSFSSPQPNSNSNSNSNSTTNTIARSTVPPNTSLTSPRPNSNSHSNSNSNSNSNSTTNTIAKSTVPPNTGLTSPRPHSNSHSNSHSNLLLLPRINNFPIVERNASLPDIPFLITLRSSVLPVKNWAFEIATGIGVANHSIIDDPLWDDQDFQNEHTKTLGSFMFDVRLSRTLKNNFRMSLGLKYATHFRMFSYEDESKIYARQEMPNPYQYLESTQTTEYRFHHQHRTLGLEAMLTKGITRNRTTAYAGLGIGINMLNRFSGNGISSALEPIDLSAFRNYKNNTGWEFLYEIGVRQTLRNDFYFHAAASGKFRYGLNVGKTHRIAPVYARIGVGKYF